jgi:pimeloyl-ACP methyl ester carboxylesterase
MQHRGSPPGPAAAERESDAPAAVSEGHAQVLGYRMRYLEAGTGEPVILLHGLADSAETWSRVQGGLARHFRVLAPDLLGCGASEKPRINYSLWAQAAYVRHFMDAVGITRAYVAGHSLGGGLAIHLYLQYPERVSRLVLVASGGMGRQLPLNLRLCTLAGSSMVIGALLASRHNRHPAARLGHALLGRLWPATNVADRLRSEAEELALEEAALAAEEDDILERLLDPDARAAFLAMLRGVGDIRGQHTSALDALHLVRVPVLLINGAHDTVIPPDHGRAAQARLPRAQLEILQQSAHCPHREEPKRVLRLLTDFLAAPEWAAEATG